MTGKKEVMPKMEARMTDSRNDLGKTVKIRRVMIPLTLQELARASGVSASELGRIEKGQRHPSASILQKIAKPLGSSESELFALAGYLSPKPGAERPSGRLDPYVATVLLEEPVEIQRAVVAILSILKSMTKGSNYSIGFAEYARRKYPELEEDIITMIENILEHPPKGGGLRRRAKALRHQSDAE